MKLNRGDIEQLKSIALYKTTEIEENEDTIFVVEACAKKLDDEDTQLLRDIAKKYNVSFEKILDIWSKSFSINIIFEKYWFTKTLEEAISIEQDKDEIIEEMSEGE